jgi:hypothetical protein
MMKLTIIFFALTAGLLLGSAHGQNASNPAGTAVTAGPPAVTQPGTPVTLKGCYLCQSMTHPWQGPHTPVLIAFEGTPNIRAEVDQILRDYFPDRGLDCEAALKLQDQIAARLKYFIATNSPAYPAPKRNHYCAPAEMMAVTGVLSERDGRKYIHATAIKGAGFKYPEKMMMPDKPFLHSEKEPLLLKVNETLTLKCIPIPPGTFLMGSQIYQQPYYTEEFAHPVTLTKTYYLSEIPITREIYEAVMGGPLPGPADNPQRPMRDATFANIHQFCRLLSEKNGRRVRLPTDAEWEYAARSGTSNPGFGAKYQGQNSSGPNGLPLPVRSKPANAWGFYDLVSCWWEITSEPFYYNARTPEIDPSRPYKDGYHSVRGNPKAYLRSISVRELSDIPGGVGLKFRVLVEGRPSDL